jgi:hypothetical protein
MLSAKWAAARYEAVEFVEHQGVLSALILATSMRKTVVNTIFSLDGMVLAWPTERTLSDWNVNSCNYKNNVQSPHVKNFTAHPTLSCIPK